jgi:hypothetical protein
MVASFQCHPVRIEGSAILCTALYTLGEKVIEVTGRTAAREKLLNA